MYIQKISNKASVFLNHKHFHPGNAKNREKVWLAEQKLKEEEKKQHELLKKRKKEWEIEQLKNDLKQLNRNNDFVRENLTEYRSNKKLKDVFSEKINKNFTLSNLYKEDILNSNHSSIWGSYYDIKQQKWGYNCCKNTTKNSICSLTNTNNSTVKYKKFKDESSIEISQSNYITESKVNKDPNEKLPMFIGKPYKKKQEGISEFLNVLRKSKSIEKD